MEASMVFSRFLPFALAGLLVAACSDSQGPSDDTVAIADLVGTWQASSHQFADNANSAVQVDLIALGGETRMTVLASGGARTWVTIGDCAAGPQPPCLYYDEFDASLSIAGNVLTITPVEASRDVMHYDLTLAGAVLTLTRSDAMFDFTLQGGEGVPATQRIVMTRQ
jgi:hypothetical protein